MLRLYLLSDTQPTKCFPAKNESNINRKKTALRNQGGFLAK